MRCLCPWLFGSGRYLHHLRGYMDIPDIVWTYKPIYTNGATVRYREDPAKRTGLERSVSFNVPSGARALFVFGVAVGVGISWLPFLLRSEGPLVLCTHTSVKNLLHSHCFSTLTLCHDIVDGSGVNMPHLLHCNLHSGRLLRGLSGLFGLQMQACDNMGVIILLLILSI